jgi:hypothetical protein
MHRHVSILLLRGGPSAHVVGNQAVELENVLDWTTSPGEFHSEPTASCFVPSADQIQKQINVSSFADDLVRTASKQVHYFTQALQVGSQRLQAKTRIGVEGHTGVE